MNLGSQFLFFFSALGAFNGLFLRAYLAFAIKNRSKATYFLAALMFVISVRVAKSVVFSFYPQTSSVFIQIGLTACCLIGPLLFLYTEASLKQSNSKSYKWIWHIIPVIVAMIAIGIVFPYRENWQLWRVKTFGLFGVFLFIYWSLYLFASVYLMRGQFVSLLSAKDKLDNGAIWLINVVIGNILIWLAYHVSYYTSYIVGAISFSFIFYLSLILWLFRKKTSTLFEPKLKYAKKTIDNEEAISIASGLDSLMQGECYKRPDLKLKDVAGSLGIPPHTLSQYLNDNVDKSFVVYINEFRISAAIEMLKMNDAITIEAIGNECGFNSNSSFYGAFKRIVGMTPAQFKRSVK